MTLFIWSVNHIPNPAFSPKILALSWKAEMVCLLLDMPQVRSSSLHSSSDLQNHGLALKPRFPDGKVDQKKCKDRFHEVTCIRIPGEQHFGLMCQTTFSFSLGRVSAMKIPPFCQDLLPDSLMSMDYGHAQFYYKFQIHHLIVE